MQIQGITIEGFANIGKVQLDFSEMNVLIARNGYGKSNVLRAIEFGVQFLAANENKRRQMLGENCSPLNKSIVHRDFAMEIKGNTLTDGISTDFRYGFRAAWHTSQAEGGIREEWLLMKEAQKPRFRQLLLRQNATACLYTPSVKGRCAKPLEVSSLQPALHFFAMSNQVFFQDLARQITQIAIPNLETLDNPENYFSADGNKGIDILGGRTISEYLYHLKLNDRKSYDILTDGLMQLLPGVEELSAEAITLADGQSRLYAIRVKEAQNITATSIRQLSSGSKRMICLFTLCIAAQKQEIPLIMMEEPENSVHPRLMENLVCTQRSYAAQTKILMTSHSPYLMRYMQPEQMYFGLPSPDGLAQFAKINPAKLAYLYRYAADMELTIGEFMFDFMLDLENDTEKLQKIFELPA